MLHILKVKFESMLSEKSQCFLLGGGGGGGGESKQGSLSDLDVLVPSFHSVFSDTV